MLKVFGLVITTRKSLLDKCWNAYVRGHKLGYELGLTLAKYADQPSFAEKQIGAIVDRCWSETDREGDNPVY